MQANIYYLTLQNVLKFEENLSNYHLIFISFEIVWNQHTPPEKLNGRPIWHCKVLDMIVSWNRLRFRFMVFNVTFNNISVISWRSVLMVEGNRSAWRKPLTCRKSLTSFNLKCCIEYTSPWTGFELNKSQTNISMLRLQSGPMVPCIHVLFQPIFGRHFFFLI